MLAYTPVEFNYLETLAKTFIIPARQNQFIQENVFNNAPVRRIAIAMNTNSAFTGSYTENPFWYQQFELRQIRKLRGGQPIVDFDATENCHYPELVGEPLRLELYFTFPLEHVTELILLGERMSSVAVDKFSVVGKNI